MNREKAYGLRGAHNPELGGLLHSPLHTAGFQPGAEAELRGHRHFIDNRRRWHRVQTLGLWEDEAQALKLPRGSKPCTYPLQTALTATLMPTNSLTASRASCLLLLLFPLV